MYGIASGLRGFQSSALRVRIERTDGNYVFVVTADLLDAGTHLVLDASQVTAETPATIERHTAGLVTFA